MNPSHPGLHGGGVLVSVVMVSQAKERCSQQQHQLMQTTGLCSMSSSAALRYCQEHVQSRADCLDGR